MRPYPVPVPLPVPPMPQPAAKVPPPSTQPVDPARQGKREGNDGQDLDRVDYDNESWM